MAEPTVGEQLNGSTGYLDLNLSCSTRPSKVAITVDSAVVVDST